uniref:NADH-ubiquinone oxidoreductase chain 2 n=1 Tax=Proasellus karamani TaxID=1281987 RepID=A0A485M7F7_9CRUS|nr:NADH dehydrogenase subunit 2 [Proasellus karamani]
MLFSTLLGGIILMLNSKTWFSVWLGLEINMLSFLPMILLSSPRSSESGLKYFLVQAIASLVILQVSFSWSIFPLHTMFLLIPLALKLGMAPLHFWLPDVVKAMNWRINMLLLTLQKIGPLYLMASISASSGTLLILVGLSSAMVGALGGLNETDLRKLMAFSSIGHMGWIAIGIMVSALAWALYLLTYILMATTFMMALEKMQAFQLTQLTAKTKSSSLIMITLLSLGGFPPFLGFAPKWAVLSESLNTSPLIAIILVVASIITLYYYIRAGLSTLVSTGVSNNMSTPLPPLLTTMLYTNILGGGLYMLMWSSLVL